MKANQTLLAESTCSIVLPSINLQFHTSMIRVSALAAVLSVTAVVNNSFLIVDPFMVYSCCDENGKGAAR
jgi:hypothetical protein